MRSIFKSLTTDGADAFEPLENDVTLSLPVYSDKTVVTPDMDSAAAENKILSYAFGTTDFDSLRQHIAQYKAILLLIKCDDGFFGTTTPTFTTPKYGHFVVAYDYTPTSIKIIDSTEREFPLKEIGKQYITSDFIKESGTAIDLPPQEVQKIIDTSTNVASQIVNAPISIQDKKNLLDELVAVLSYLSSLLSQKVGSTSQQNMTNYSFLKSRTFWTIVVQFLSNGFLAISGNFNPTVVLLVNAALGSLATYFHDAGVNNAAVASAQATAATTTGAVATPVSGQK